MKVSEKINKSVKSLVPMCVEEIKSLMEQHNVQYIPYKDYLIDRIALFVGKPYLVCKDGVLKDLSSYAFDMFLHLSWLRIVEDYFDNVPNKNIGYTYETTLKYEGIEYEKKEDENEVVLVCKLPNGKTELTFKMNKVNALWSCNGEDFMTFSLLFNKYKWDFYK